MSTYLRDFYTRRRTGLAITAGLIGGGYFAFQYAKSRLSDLRSRMVEEKATADNIQRRFKQTQDDCVFTIQALLPTAGLQLLATLDVETLTKRLQALSKKSETPTVNSDLSISQSSDVTSTQLHTTGDSISTEGATTEHQVTRPLGESVIDESKRKSELWQQIKIQSIAGALSACYLAALVVLQAHVQLHLLARYNYVGSVLDLADAGDASPSLDTLSRPNGLDKHLEPRGIPQETELRFLTFSWWLLHKGWKQIVTKVEAAVSETFGKIQLKASITPHELARLLFKARLLAESKDKTTGKSAFLSALMPQTAEEEIEVLHQGGVPETAAVVDLELRQLLDESLDVFEAEDFTAVLTACLDALFKQLLDKLDPCFKELPETNKAIADDKAFQHPLAKIVEIEDRKARLVNLLPTFTQEAPLIVNANPNSYLDSLSDVHQLRDFSTIIFAPSRNVLLQSRHALNTTMNGHA